LPPDAPLRVAILSKQLAGYSSACFRALAEEGTDIHLVYRQAIADVPYNDDDLARGFKGHPWDTTPDQDRIQRELDEFAPDALVVISWDVGAYRRVARSMRGRVLRVLCMDNPWLATPKQWGGVLLSPLVIRPTYDIAFLPDERQAAFARRLGFGDDRILWGFYTCDHEAFDSAAPDPRRAERPGFVFVGRLVETKGVDTLARAYLRYREIANDPWPLTVCGIGPLATTLGAISGVEMRGFLQPTDLPQLFQEAACLVLPSTWEPWGVVIHEAATAGLAVVCTTACGAASRLVLDGYNGAVVKPGDHEGLARAMAEVSSMGPSSLQTFGARSQELARQYTPQRWAKYLLHGIENHRQRLGLTT